MWAWAGGARATPAGRRNSDVEPAAYGRVTKRSGDPVAIVLVGSAAEDRNGLGAGADAELRVDRRNVGLDGGSGDVSPFTDLFEGQMGGELVEDLVFGRRQHRQAARRAGGVGESIGQCLRVRDELERRAGPVRESSSPSPDLRVPSRFRHTERRALLGATPSPLPDPDAVRPWRAPAGPDRDHRCVPRCSLRPSRAPARAPAARQSLRLTMADPSSTRSVAAANSERSRWASAR